jgi:putative DNA primase/helicase
LEYIFQRDKFGTQFRERFLGSLDNGDHSLTCIRILNTLAYFTNGDAARMRALMLLSPLARDKWFSKRGKNGDWLDLMIADAIDYLKKRK